MKLLAFDTSTDTLSIAVQRGTGAAAQCWQYQGVGGAQASAALIATVLDLLQQAQLKLGQLDAICFGSGPGSFTGLRTACAVAQGLAFGAQVPVLPVDSLLALAETARHAQLAAQAQGQVMALLDARMDEMYMARFAFAGGHWQRQSATCLLRPEALQLDAQAGLSLAGNVFEVYAGRLAWPAGTLCLPALPSASAMLRLAPEMLEQGLAVTAAQALPTYIRDKVAQTTDERAAIKAAQAAAAQSA